MIQKMKMLYEQVKTKLQERIQMNVRRARQGKDEELKKAIRYIDDYCEREGLEKLKGDEKISSIPIAYSTSDDEEHEIEVEIDLAHWEYAKWIDGRTIAVKTYRSLQEMCDLLLKDMAFDDLIYGENYEKEIDLVKKIESRIREASLHRFTKSKGDFFVNLALAIEMIAVIFCIAWLANFFIREARESVKTVTPEPIVIEASDQEKRGSILVNTPDGTYGYYGDIKIEKDGSSGEEIHIIMSGYLEGMTN